MRSLKKSCKLRRGSLAGRRTRRHRGPCRVDLRTRSPTRRAAGCAGRRVDVRSRSEPSDSDHRRRRRRAAWPCRRAARHDRAGSLPAESRVVCQRSIVVTCLSDLSPSSPSKPDAHARTCSFGWPSSSTRQSRPSTRRQTYSAHSASSASCPFSVQHQLLRSCRYDALVLPLGEQPPGLVPPPLVRVLEQLRPAPPSSSSAGRTAPAVRFGSPLVLDLVDAAVGLVPVVDRVEVGGPLVVPVGHVHATRPGPGSSRPGGTRCRSRPAGRRRARP